MTHIHLQMLSVFVTLKSVQKQNTLIVHNLPGTLTRSLLILVTVSVW
jgi:hypothetical protein